MSLAITAPAASLLAAAQRASLAARKRDPIVCLRSLLLTTDHDGAWFEATDLDFAARARIDRAEVQTAGRLALHCAGLLACLALVPGSQRVLLAEQGGAACLSAAGITVWPDTMPAEDFQVLAGPEDASPFTLLAGTLARLLQTTLPAISLEETRYYLNGVFLHRPEGTSGILRAVATDGHRLHFADAPLPEGAAEMPSTIVPRRAIRALRKALEGMPAEAEIAVTLCGDPPRLAVDAPGWQIRSTTIDGKFPDYLKVVPAPEHTVGRLTVHDPVRFATLTEIATSQSEVTAEPIVLRLRPDGALVLSSREANKPGCAGATAVVPRTVAAWEGPPMDEDVGFQGRYLRDLCSAIPGGFTLMTQADKAAPALIVGRNETAVLMPVRL